MDQTNESNCVAVFDRHEDAEVAIRELQRAGFDMKKLSIVGRDYHTEEHAVGFYNAGDHVKYWGKTGAFWGGVFGVLLAPAFFWIPGIGPILTFVPNVFGGLPGASAQGTSFMGGGQAGYNWQAKQWVFGVEGDIDATHIRASIARNAINLAGFTPAFDGNVASMSTFSNDWVGSIRGRVGIATGRALFYGTAGVAFADSSVNTGWIYTPPANAIPAFIQPGPTGARSSQTLVGWTAGVGGEWMFTNKVSVGAEYRHSDFGTHSYLLGIDTAGTAVFGNVKYTADQVTVRANWHLQ